MTTLHTAWQLCRRHWGAFLALAFWFMGPWLAGALSGDLTLALPLSWMGGIPFVIYMYRATAASHVLGILPLARREVWQIACVAGAVVPALVQLTVATVVWVVVLFTFPHYNSTHRAGLDMVLLGALYSLAFFLLVVIAAASVRRQRWLTAVLAIAAMVTLTWFVGALPARVGDFTTPSVLVLAVAVVLAVVLIRIPGALAAPVPANSQTYRFTIDLPGIGILDRLTGIKRILLVHTLYGFVLFAAAFLVVVVGSVWVDGVTMTEKVAQELSAFSGVDGWVLQPGATLLFTPMWVIGFSNIWTPMARQLRVLPLTPREANAVFLASPIAMWMALWAMYVTAYVLAVGGPFTPRLDLFLAISGSSTLANVISFRWKNRLFGMVGVAFVYGFWMAASLATALLNLTLIQAPLIAIGVALYIAAVAINHHTLVHATGASAAYQRQPKFFDTPARS